MVAQQAYQTTSVRPRGSQGGSKNAAGNMQLDSGVSTGTMTGRQSLGGSDPLMPDLGGSGASVVTGTNPQGVTSIGAGTFSLLRSNPSLSASAYVNPRFGSQRIA